MSAPAGGTSTIPYATCIDVRFHAKGPKRRATENGHNGTVAHGPARPPGGAGATGAPRENHAGRPTGARDAAGAATHPPGRRGRLLLEVPL